MSNVTCLFCGNNSIVEELEYIDTSVPTFYTCGECGLEWEASFKDADFATIMSHPLSDLSDYAIVLLGQVSQYLGTSNPRVMAEACARNLVAPDNWTMSISKYYVPKEV